MTAVIKRLMKNAREHIFAIVIVLVAGVVLWLAVDIRYFNKTEPPMSYSATEYVPDKSIYAPGETLHFTPTLTMGHGGRVTGLRTIINAQTHLAARLCDGGPTKKYPIEQNLDRGVYGDVVTGAPSVTIEIEKMPPGRYKVATNINGYGDQAGQVGHDVYFAITEPC